MEDGYAQLMVWAKKKTKQHPGYRDQNGDVKGCALSKATGYKKAQRPRDNGD